MTYPSTRHGLTRHGLTCLRLWSTMYHHTVSAKSTMRPLRKRLVVLVVIAPKLAGICSKSSQTKSIVPEIGRSRSRIGQSRPKLAKNAPKLIKVAQTSP